MCGNMVLFRTLFNAHGHICITKVLGKWWIAGVAIYGGFPNVIFNREFLFIDFFMSAQWGWHRTGARLYKWVYV
jgi:hypothetical protein